MANLHTREDDTLKQNEISFELRDDPFYSPENQARLLISKARMEQTGGTVHELIDDAEIDN